MICPIAARGVLLIVWLWVALVVAEVGVASDGILEINDACAINTGCFPGDGPGYPVTIASPGSFLLTSSLVLADASTSGITISSSDVLVDLKGFSIIVAACVNVTTNCTPLSGSSVGIEVLSSDFRNVTLKNGTVVGTSNAGIRVYNESEVRNITARNILQQAIWVGDDSRVIGCSAFDSFSSGIFAGVRATIWDNKVAGNGGHGIQAGFGSSVIRNSAYENGVAGINGFNGSTIEGNTAYLNGAGGIHGGTGSVVRGNASYQNTGNGLQGGGLIQGNSSFNNTGFGLLAGSTAGYTANVFSNNTAGTVSGGVNLGSNSCDSTATCP